MTLTCNNCNTKIVIKSDYYVFKNNIEELAHGGICLINNLMKLVPPRFGLGLFQDSCVVMLK